LYHERSREFALVDLPQDYDTYFRSLSGNARSMLNRRTKAILERDHASFHMCTIEEERPAFLDALFRLHRERWQQRGEEGSFVRKPAMVAFYREFTRLALSRGWLRLCGLKIEGEFRAVQVGYVYGDTYSQLQEGFGRTVPDGIGNVLRSLAIRSLIKEGVRCYDFLGGYSEHKRRWLSRMRTGCDLFMARPNLKTQLLFYKEVWPIGRFIAEDHPAGKSRQ
jgi:CelD/BcsL family acetyltransferase involved in cellulose biosynthesis